MKYYKTLTEIMAIDENQEELVQKDWIEITFEEVMEITNPPLSEKEIEAKRISSINLKAGEIIEAKYPIYKQLNITNLLAPYTDQDKEQMKVFIDGIRKIANDSIDNKTALEDINWGGIY